MNQKPLTVARQEYMDSICQATNKSGLPAFVIAGVLEKVLSEISRQTDAEYKADLARYRAALVAEKTTQDKPEPKDGEVNG